MFNVSLLVYYPLVCFVLHMGYRTLKMATAVFAETFGKLQRFTRFIHTPHMSYLLHC
jgi:hypothetical protein